MKGFKDSINVSTPNNQHHDLSHTINTSADLFQFRPVFCEEMYPSDHFKVSVSDYFRADPLAGPVYAQFRKKYAAFFVPYRILWDNWNDYLTGGSDGRINLILPYIDFNKYIELADDLHESAESETGTNAKKHKQSVYRNIMDFWSDLGIPIDQLYLYAAADFKQDVDEFGIPILRLLAMRNIWFDWYRDQNLISDDLRDYYCPKSFPVNGNVNVSVDADDYFQFNNSNINNNILLAMPPVAVEKDYFTTAMTEPQRGGAAFVPVQLPSADLNPGFQPSPNSNSIYLKPEGGIYASGNGPTSATNIVGQFDYNLIRYAKGVQKYLEKNNIAGGADLQQLLAHWGTAPNPAVFGRSTYIGSFTDSFNPTEVISNMSVGDSVAGEVSTKVNASGNGTFEYTANEHGFFVIIQTIRPENTYVSGFRREVLHGCLGNGRFDFFTPELEATGMQPQYNYEKTGAVFLSENRDASVYGVCGYVPRYAECKRAFNRFTGQMQTHLYRNLRIARDLGQFVQIDDDDLFINTNFSMVYGYPVDYPYDLIFKVENPLLDHFQGWIHFDWQADRPMHQYASPLIEDAKGNDITLPYAGVRM